MYLKFLEVSTFQFNVADIVSLLCNRTRREQAFGKTAPSWFRRTHAMTHCQAQGNRTSVPHWFCTDKFCNCQVYLLNKFKQLSKYISYDTYSFVFHIINELEYLGTDNRVDLSQPIPVGRSICRPRSSADILRDFPARRSAAYLLPAITGPTLKPCTLEARRRL